MEKWNSSVLENNLVSFDMTGLPLRQRCLSCSLGHVLHYVHPRFFIIVPTYICQFHYLKIIHITFVALHIYVSISVVPF